LIVGNSDFRLKTGETKILSNLGVNLGYFDAREHKANILLGNGSNNEIDIVTYEFF
jgi:hypothetical protein